MESEGETGFKWLHVCFISLLTEHLLVLFITLLITHDCKYGRTAFITVL